MDSKARTIGGKEFQSIYEAPRDFLAHADYLGKKNGYHYIAIYDAGCTDWSRYRYSLRTPVDELPASFPSTPQMPKWDGTQPHTSPLDDRLGHKTILIGTWHAGPNKSCWPQIVCDDGTTVEVRTRSSAPSSWQAFQGKPMRVFGTLRLDPGTIDPKEPTPTDPTVPMPQPAARTYYLEEPIQIELGH